MCGKPRKGFLHHSNQMFSELFEILKTCSGWRKYFFDSLRRPGNRASCHFSAQMQRAWQMEGMDSPWKLEVGESRAPVGAKTIFFHFPCRIPERR